jgi:hypothetical protein
LQRRHARRVLCHRRVLLLLGVPGHGRGAAACGSCGAAVLPAPGPGGLSVTRRHRCPLQRVTARPVQRRARCVDILRPQHPRLAGCVAQLGEHPSRAMAPPSHFMRVVYPPCSCSCCLTVP